MEFVYAAILLLLAIGGVVVRKTYYYLPAHELKRRAEKDDPLGRQLYRAVAYGGSLRSLLWLYIGLMTAGSLIILARNLPIWASLLVVGPILWAAFSWLPASRVTRVGSFLARTATPIIVWILNYLHPALSRSTEAIEKRTSTRNHTGIFEREDLIELIEQQKRQPDNRLSTGELEIAKRALSFDDYKVADILTPRKKVKTILADDTVGPILIDEIHKSGQNSVLVREDKKGPVIGSLSFAQLGLSSSGQVREVMNPTVYYIHEDDALSEALHAFFTTNHPLFVVVNSFEEFVGIITIENILRQLVGHVEGNDFDQYTSLNAVANRHVKQKEPEETPVKTDDEMVE